MARQLFNAIIVFPCKDFVSIPLPTKMVSVDLCNIALTHKRIPPNLRFYFGLLYFDKLKLRHHLKDSDIVNNCDIPHSFRKKYLYLYLKFYPADLNDMEDPSFLSMIHWFLWKDLTEGHLRSNLESFYSMSVFHTLLLRETCKEYRVLDEVTCVQRGVLVPSWVTESLHKNSEFIESGDQQPSNEMTPAYENIMRVYQNCHQRSIDHPLNEFLSMVTHLPLYSFHFHSLKVSTSTINGSIDSRAQFLGLNYSGISEFHAPLEEKSCPSKTIPWFCLISFSTNRKLLTIVHKTDVSNIQFFTSRDTISPSASPQSVTTMCETYKFHSCHDCRLCRLSIKEHWNQYKSSTCTLNVNVNVNVNEMKFRTASSESLRMEPTRKHSFAHLRLNQSVRDGSRRLSVSNPNLFHLQCTNSSTSLSSFSNNDTTSVASANHSIHDYIPEEKEDGTHLVKRRKELLVKMKELEEELYGLNEQERSILRRTGNECGQVRDVRSSTPRLIVLNKSSTPTITNKMCSPRYASHPGSLKNIHVASASTHARSVTHSHVNGASLTIRHHIKKHNRLQPPTPSIISSSALSLDSTLPSPICKRPSPRYNWKLASDNISMRNNSASTSHHSSCSEESDVNSTPSSAVATPSLYDGDSFHFSDSSHNLELYQQPLQPIHEHYYLLNEAVVE